MKVPVEFVVICLLTILNLRGVKESVKVLMPIFLTFLVTHAILITVTHSAQLASLFHTQLHMTDGQLVRQGKREN